MWNFRLMVNTCIRIGLKEDAATLKRLSVLSYHELAGFKVLSYYKLCAISRAAGILASRKKSLRRGYPSRDPYMRRQILTSCYGFEIVDSKLKIPLREHVFELAPLNRHMMEAISGLKIESFTLTEEKLSLCVSKGVEAFKPVGLLGVDRNLKNITLSDGKDATIYDVSKLVEISDVTRSILRSFRRNDSRMRSRIYGKYGARRRERTRQLLHKVSKKIILGAKEQRLGIVFEDIREIRKLYGTGNGQSRRFHGRMNSWPFQELKRQVEYKAGWEGVPVFTLSKHDTRGTSKLCPQCGERLQETQLRQLVCQICKEQWDRDVVAAVNIALRGRVRFARSEGGASEAMRQELFVRIPKLILKVDASKLGQKT